MGVRISNLFSLRVILSKRLAVVVFFLCLFAPSFVIATEDSPLKIGPPLDSLKTTELHDSFNEMHQGHRHEAIDIMRPRGAPIRSVTDGFIRKVFISRQGGLTIYEFDRESAYCFYYAHLDHYADIHEGMAVARGDVIGYVGTTGDALPDAPQLHFAIFKLGPDKSWWKGEAIDPYPILMRAVTEAQSVWIKAGRAHRLKPVPPLGQERGWPYGFNIFSSAVSVA
ncbi:M23 family metallopeptidase [Candidatus Binatus sp.]|uniref:M23 family metallopeptidase n=1 Tax=Candidatus Binatus sp. TaxID=2811406 RepID=UPI003BAF1A90